MNPPSAASSTGVVFTVVRLLCTLAVSGVFLYAAALKIYEPRQFAVDIRNYHMVPESLLNIMAIFMPWFEVGAAVALLIPSWRRAGAILIVAMLLMFITAVCYAAFYKGYNIHCGCFGKKSAEAGLETIALDVSLLICTIISVWPRRRFAQAGFEVAA